MIIILIHPT